MMINSPKSLTTVTPLSKILAGVLFVILPFLGFYLGREYEKKIVQNSTLTNTNPPDFINSTQLKSMSCDQLEKALSNEYETWNLSCETDSDCRESEIKQCNCQSVNTNTQKSKEIDEIIRLKECVRPLLQCELFKCSCENKVCTYNIIDIAGQDNLQLDK